ncbi:MAG: hypothetical protein J5746_09420, partial [Victivallales bacterium]|nr:hypothetical protein [Victivallales bacterium]
QMNDADATSKKAWFVKSGKEGDFANCKTMCDFKEGQLKHGDGYNDSYEITTFPVISCFHHAKYRDGNNNVNRYAPVLQISYAGNFFLSRVHWEEGVWTP